MRPDQSSYPEYFHKYIQLVKENDILSAMQNEEPKGLSFLRSISESQSNYKYAEDKWTLKELLQHVIDTERIFNYRALSIARMETNSLPGFDENAYAENSHANDRTWDSLVDEYVAVRKSTIAFIQSLHEADLSKSGPVNTYHISVLAMLYTTLGHELHHLNVIKERYLN